MEAEAFHVCQAGNGLRKRLIGPFARPATDVCHPDGRATSLGAAARPASAASDYTVRRARGHFLKRGALGERQRNCSSHAALRCARSRSSCRRSSVIPPTRGAGWLRGSGRPEGGSPADSR
jgi:hypothetical protein